MKIKFIILFIQLQLSYNFLNAQNVKLVITIDSAKDASEIWFCRSIDGNAINYCPMYDKTVIHNKNAEKLINVNTCSVINIISEELLPKISLICQKNDIIKFRVIQEGRNLYSINFEGNNAEGQLFFYQSPLFHNYLLTPILGARLEDMIKSEKPLKTIITKLDSIKNYLFLTADSLSNNRKITISFYNLIKLQSNMQFLSALESCIQNTLDKLSLNGKDLLLNKVQILMNELKRFYYKQYDPFTSLYDNIDQNLRIVNCQNKCSLIEKGILQGVKNDIGLWSRLADQNFSFAPKEVQHRIMAINLSFNGFYNKNNKQSLNDSNDFELLKSKFPNSPYLPTLDKYFRKKIIFQLKDSL